MLIHFSKYLGSILKKTGIKLILINVVAIYPLAGNSVSTTPTRTVRSYLKCASPVLCQVPMGWPTRRPFSENENLIRYKNLTKFWTWNRKFFLWNGKFWIWNGNFWYNRLAQFGDFWNNFLKIVNLTYKTDIQARTINLVACICVKQKLISIFLSYPIFSEAAKFIFMKYWLGNLYI